MTGNAERPATREWSVARGRSRLHIREIGDGPPVLVLHGGPDFDHEYLLPEMDRLAEELRLVYYDQRGRGRSFSGEGARDVTIESEMDDLDAVREAAGLGPIALLGHSWGVLLALEFAVRHPDRVSHLILMNPAPVSHEGAVAFRRALAARRSPAQTARLRELVSQAGYQRGDVEADAEYHRIHFGATFSRTEYLDAVVGRLRRAFTREGIVAARAIEAALYEQTWNREDYDLTPALRSLPMPAVVIAGDRDLCPPEVARQIAEAIPNARLVALEDCGHFAYLEQSSTVRAVVSDLFAPSRQDEMTGD